MSASVLYRQLCGSPTRSRRVFLWQQIVSFEEKSKVKELVEQAKTLVVSAKNHDRGQTY